MPNFTDKYPVWIDHKTKAKSRIRDIILAVVIISMHHGLFEFPGMLVSDAVNVLHSDKEKLAVCRRR